MKGLSPKLPLTKSPLGGYTSNITLPEMIKQNLKNLFFTIPGERIMDPYFGIGIKKYLFEPNIKPTYDILKTKISEQVKKYMPFVSIISVNFSSSEENQNLMFVSFNYLISPTNQVDRMDLVIKP